MDATSHDLTGDTNGNTASVQKNFYFGSIADALRASYAGGRRPDERHKNKKDRVSRPRTGKKYRRKPRKRVTRRRYPERTKPTRPRVKRTKPIRGRKPRKPRTPSPLRKKPRSGSHNPRSKPSRPPTYSFSVQSETSGAPPLPPPLGCHPSALALRSQAPQTPVIR